MIKIVKNNLILLLLCNFASIYIASNNKEIFIYILFSSILISYIYLFALCNTYIINKKNQGLQQSLIIVLSLLYFTSFTIFLPSSIIYLLPITLITLYIWFRFIKKIVLSIKSNPSFIYNKEKYTKLEYTILLERYTFVNKINLIFLPLLFTVLLTTFIINFKSELIILKIFPLFIAWLSILYFTKKIKNNNLFYNNNASNIIYDELHKYQPDFILYFSGNSKSTYQINSWLPLLSIIKFKFVIFLREHHHYGNLENSEYPIVFLKDTIDIEKNSSITSIKAALYTTNVGKNIHLIRDIRIKHIFIGHGDSDKSGSANNLMKLYDHMFVAGDAHIDRMNKNNIVTPENYFYKIGRPQLELLSKKKKSSNKKINLLYAPTWEGYYENSCYSSLNIIHNQLEEYINKNKSTVDFLFRPHPHTGVVNKKYNNIKKRLMNLTNYKYNNLHDCFQFADILITDISGILSDFIYLNKPIILYHPEVIDNIKSECPISSCCYILDKNSSITDLIKKIKYDDYLLEDRMKMKSYIMGDDKLSYIKKFSNALKSINP